MKSTVVRFAVGFFLASALPSSGLFAAEEGTKALPTLLIKGEVMVVDSADPNAVLLKVKDRYGFETPIFLPQDAKIMQGDQTVAVADLTPGTAVEVEYNFDINTAKRHAVSVKLAVPAPAATTAATPADATPPVTLPVTPPAPEPSVPEAPAQATPVPQEAAPATQPSSSTSTP